jgi:hypothetical protein
MPESVRLVVGQLVAEAQSRPRESDERPNGYLLTCGPAASVFLDADGEVWYLDLGDLSIHPVNDGPQKVGLIAIAAARAPELAGWLPRRPPEATNCQACQASGWLQPPFSRVQCPECYGLGWVTRPST